MDNLLNKKCVPCEAGGILPFTKEEAEKYLTQLSNWGLNEEARAISKEFKFKDLETKGFLKTFVGPFLRKHYLTRLDEHKRKLNWVANSLGARFYSISTNKLIYDAFNERVRD